MARERFPGGDAAAVEHKGPSACRRTTRRDPVMLGRLMAALALLAGGLGTAQAKDERAEAASVASHVERPRVVQTAGNVLDQRVQLMARELALAATQQEQLRGILQAQRDDVARAWRDPSVPAAVRIAATRSIGEKTADRIRAILSDEQREKYMKSHQHDAQGGGDVERWMKAAQGSAPSAGPARPAVAKGN